MNSQARLPAAHATGPGSHADRATVSAEGLVYSYGNTPALRGVSLQVQRGEILTITGPSGSGKSTLMLCLSGVLRPDAGEVCFDDRIISQASESDRSRMRRSEFGILFQFGQLVPELTVIENVALPLLLAGVNRKAAFTAATAWLDRFGVADKSASHPTEMSGGQAQRAAAARAMVTEPSVLFADEPTGSLDALAAEQVMSQIVQVARQASTSVVIITHDATIAAYGDREVVVRDGRIDATNAVLES